MTFLFFWTLLCGLTGLFANLYFQPKEGLVLAIMGAIWIFGLMVFVTIKLCIVALSVQKTGLKVDPYPHS